VSVDQLFPGNVSQLLVRNTVGTEPPAEMKLQIAMNATTDEYTQQWVTTMYKELRKYEHFKQAFKELLLSPQIQSQVRCSRYHDRFGKNWVESLSAHFLRYATIAANLTPKMSELEVTDAMWSLP
jgi:hypothetical protein